MIWAFLVIVLVLEGCELRVLSSLRAARRSAVIEGRAARACAESSSNAYEARCACVTSRPAMWHAVRVTAAILASGRAAKRAAVHVVLHDTLCA